MLISEALEFAKNNLKKQGIDSFGIDALLILCHSLVCTKEKIIFNPNLALTPDEESKFLANLKRRESREPISHILGKREFFGFDFTVSKDVLDPRADSESLIELALETFPDKDENLEILELGVGSGCLILTLLKLFPNCAAVAVDQSPKALEMAKKNAKNLEIANRIKLLKSDWFSNLDAAQKFDLIISNPPYIESQQIELLEAEVKNFEPRAALDGGDDGLDCYRDIAGNAGKFLKDSGFLILEIGRGQEEDVKEIFTQAGLKFVKEKQDLAGIIRALLFEK